MNELTAGDCVAILGEVWASENGIRTIEDMMQPARAEWVDLVKQVVESRKSMAIAATGTLSNYELSQLNIINKEIVFKNREWMENRLEENEFEEWLIPIIEKIKVIIARVPGGLKKKVEINYNSYYDPLEIDGKGIQAIINARKCELPPPDAPASPPSQGRRRL